MQSNGQLKKKTKSRLLKKQRSKQYEVNFRKALLDPNIINTLPSYLKAALFKAYKKTNKKHLRKNPGLNNWANEAIDQLTRESEQHRKMTWNARYAFDFILDKPVPCKTNLEPVWYKMSTIHGDALVNVNPHAPTDPTTNLPLPKFAQNSSTEVEEWFKADWDYLLAHNVATQIAHYFDVVHIPDDVTHVRFCIRDWPYRHDKWHVYENVIDNKLKENEVSWVLSEVDFRHFKELGSKPEWVLMLHLRPKGISDLASSGDEIPGFVGDKPSEPVNFGRTEKPQVRALQKVDRDKVTEKKRRLEQMASHTNKKTKRKKRRK